MNVIFFFFFFGYPLPYQCTLNLNVRQNSCTTPPAVDSLLVIVLPLYPRFVFYAICVT